MKEEQTLKGVIEHIVFHNSGNGYTVAALRLAKPREAETVTIVGNFPDISEGRAYLLTGRMTTHQRYGQQFSVTAYEEEMPEGAAAIEQFLASGTIKGVGPKMAAAIVARFGEETLSVIEKEPDRLREVSGIGEKKAEAIASSYQAQREFAAIALSLQELGISGRQALTLYKIFGEDAVETVREDPYRLMEAVPGFGFRKADALAEKMGISREDPNRIRAGLSYALGYYMGEGHTFVPKGELTEKTGELLEVSRDLVTEALREAAFAGTVKWETLDGAEVVYPMALYAAERYVAFKLADLAEADLPSLFGQMDSVVDLAQKELGVIFNEEQRRAVRACMDNGVLVITGGPGTGKTTIINGILRIFTENHMTVAICAPTGRAAKRMTQTTGAPASTIHRLLEYYYDEETDEMRFGRDDKNPLTYDAVVVDEASMIDILLMQGLLKAVKPGTRLVIVGDADQLPSVGAGNVLADILRSGCLYQVALKEIHRQAAESLIVVNAHRIEQGETPYINEKEGDFFFLQRDHEPEMLATIVDLCENRLPAHYDMKEGRQTIQVITPVRKGLLGTYSLNRALQEALNPPAKDKKERTFGDRLFREGDKVMQIRNNYGLAWKRLPDEEGEGVFNGDVGTIAAIDEEAGKLLVLFDEERYAAYDFSQLEELELAYAVTVHKAQGSEFPLVVMPMTWFPPILATRNLIYTAITRAKEGVVLVGSPRRMTAMVENDYIAQRNSGLSQRLQELLIP